MDYKIAHTSFKKCASAFLCKLLIKFSMELYDVKLR
jgi:hypothetical protein